MEGQFDLILDANIKLELVQVDSDRLSELFGHEEIPDSNNQSLKVLGQTKNKFTI